MLAVFHQVALSTDMIVGFCGELQEDHLASLHLMGVTAYEQAFLFAYSKRDRTHAARHLEVRPAALLPAPAGHALDTP